LGGEEERKRRPRRKEGEEGRAWVHGARKYASHAMFEGKH